MNRTLFILLYIVLSVSVNAQTTDFTFRSEGNLYCAPAEVQFTQTSSGNPIGYLWDFGNGQRSNSPNPSISFSSPGSYTVRLIAVYENSTAEKIKTIEIKRGVNSSFTADREQLCGPGQINFVAQGSAGITRHEWNFGDDTNTYTTTSNNASHNFTNYGSYSITLTSYNEHGCSSSSVQTIHITKPVIRGSRTVSSACNPVTARFSSSITLPAGSSLLSYNWNFGDGANITGTSAQSTHTYRNAGAYCPSVTILTRDGCTNTYLFDSVFVGTPPTNHIAYTDKPVICGSEKAKFISKAVNATSYDWDFGNGQVINTRDTFIEKKYSALGIQTVTVTPKYYDCPGTPVTLQIEIIGVIAKYSYTNTCSDKRTFDFRNRSLGNISTYVWEIGQQRVPVRTYNLNRQFPPYGAFPVVLKIRDEITGCVDSMPRIIYTANPTLVNQKQSTCINTETRFRIERNYTNPQALLTWKVLNKEISTGNQTDLDVLADSLGIFTPNQVIIQNGTGYCPDTLSFAHPFTVKGPLLQFDAPENICLNESLQITNRSRPFMPQDSILQWSWNMGTPASNDNGYQPQPHTYNVHRAYNIRLAAQDINGCNDTLIKRVNVRPMPFLWIIPKADTVCQGQSSSFIAYTSDQVLWTAAQPISGLCNDCDSIRISPSSSNQLQITATNQFQCSVKDSVRVSVVEPFVARASYSDTAICQKEKLVLDINPKDKLILWTPADQVSQPNSFSPTVSPMQNTLFTALLTDSAGCFSSEANINVVVKTNPAVNIGPDKFLPYHSSFTLQPSYSTNTRQYLWTPADSLSCNNCPNPSGMAVSSKKYAVTAISDSGCIARDEIMVFVECKNANILMPKAFTPNNDRLNDLYSPITRGINYVERFSIYDRMGNLLYESRNFIPNKGKSGWDGRFRGSEQSTGAYVYLLDAICETGNHINVKGSFVLLR